MYDLKFKTADVFYAGHPLLKPNDQFTIEELEGHLETSGYSEKKIIEVISIILVSTSQSQTMVTKTLYDTYMSKNSEFFTPFIVPDKNVKEEWITPSLRVLMKYRRKVSMYTDPKVIKRIQDEMLPDFVAAAEEEYGYDDTRVKVSFTRLFDILFIGNGWENKEAFDSRD